MALDRIVSIVLRLAELVFACIVAGINGDYLHKADKADASSWEVGRFIYAEVVAGISIFLAIVWLVPFSGTFIHWPVDFIISVCWFAAFGLLVDVSLLILNPKGGKDMIESDSNYVSSKSEIAAAMSSTGMTSGYHDMLPPAVNSRP